MIWYVHEWSGEIWFYSLLIALYEHSTKVFDIAYTWQHKNKNICVIQYFCKNYI